MSIDHVKELIAKAKAYDLDGCPQLSQMPVEEVADAYNGIGAEWMPARIRERITTDYSDLEPAAMIHDVDYRTAGGTMAEFHVANFRLRANILKTADAVATPFISWRWWKLRLAATACFEAVERLGLIAYVQTTTKPKGKNK